MGLSGQCYCGRVRLSADTDPLVVAYCHCSDCRRWTGSPLPAFAAIPVSDLTINPNIEEREHSPGVHRRHCPDCGSALTARFSYLPDQVYLPIGILDQAAKLAPSLHCHADKALPWLHVADDLPRTTGSARDRLNAAS